MAVPWKLIIEIIIEILKRIARGLPKEQAISEVANFKGLSEDKVSEIFTKYGNQ